MAKGSSKFRANQGRQSTRIALHHKDPKCTSRPRVVALPRVVYAGESRPVGVIPLPGMIDVYRSSASRTWLVLKASVVFFSGLYSTNMFLLRHWLSRTSSCLAPHHVTCDKISIGLIYRNSTNGIMHNLFSVRYSTLAGGGPLPRVAVL